MPLCAGLLLWAACQARGGLSGPACRSPFWLPELRLRDERACLLPQREGRRASPQQLLGPLCTHISPPQKHRAERRSSPSCVRVGLDSSCTARVVARRHGRGHTPCIHTSSYHTLPTSSCSCSDFLRYPVDGHARSPTYAHHIYKHRPPPPTSHTRTCTHTHAHRIAGHPATPSQMSLNSYARTRSRLHMHAHTHTCTEHTCTFIQTHGWLGPSLAGDEAQLVSQREPVRAEQDTRSHSYWPFFLRLSAMLFSLHFHFVLSDLVSSLCLSGWSLSSSLGFSSSWGFYACPQPSSELEGLSPQSPPFGNPSICWHPGRFPSSMLAGGYDLLPRADGSGSWFGWNKPPSWTNGDDL